MIKNGYIILFSLLAGLSAACGKWEEEPVKSSLQFIHLSPAKGIVDLLIDNKEVAKLSYKGNTPYTDIRAGLRNIKWAVSGNNSDILLDSNVYLPENGTFSVFFIDTLSASKTKVPSLLINKESFPAVVADKAQIRFAHFSTTPDTLTLDLIVQQTNSVSKVTTPLDTILNIKFKKMSAFVPIPIDTTQQYNFLLLSRTKSIEKGIILSELPKQELKPRKTYTVSAVTLPNPAPGGADTYELILTDHNQ